MTLYQWMVCGFIGGIGVDAFMISMCILGKLSRRTGFGLFSMSVFGVMGSIVGLGLGLVWNL